MTDSNTADITAITSAPFTWVSFAMLLVLTIERLLVYTIPHISRFACYICGASMEVDTDSLPTTSTATNTTHVTFATDGGNVDIKKDAASSK